MNFIEATIKDKVIAAVSDNAKIESIKDES